MCSLLLNIVSCSYSFLCRPLARIYDGARGLASIETSMSASVLNYIYALVNIWEITLRKERLDGNCAHDVKLNLNVCSRRKAMSSIIMSGRHFTKLGTDSCIFFVKQ